MTEVAPPSASTVQFCSEIDCCGTSVDPRSYDSYDNQINFCVKLITRETPKEGVLLSSNNASWRAVPDAPN